MNLVFSALVFAAPIFSWADSLYLDSPRLGKVDDFASSGRCSHWVYTDIVVFERNSASRWCIGLRPIPASEQAEINEIVRTAVIAEAESEELKATEYCVGNKLYDSQHYEGPWDEIERLLAQLIPSYTVEVSDSLAGAGARAVHGTLYTGEKTYFRSASGVYEVAAPLASSGVEDYLKKRSEQPCMTADLGIEGILYLQEDTPLFFYVLE